MNSIHLPKPILILTYLGAGRPSGLFPSSLPTRNLYLFFFSLSVQHALPTSFFLLRSSCWWTGCGTVESSWNVMANGDTREGKLRGYWWMEWVATTLHTTSEHGLSIITTVDAHTSAASSRPNWRPRRFKWTRPFRRKTKSGLCTCAITFQTQSNSQHTLITRPAVLSAPYTQADGSVEALCHSLRDQLRPAAPITNLLRGWAIHCRSRRFERESFSALTGNQTIVVIMHVHYRTEGLLKLKDLIKLLTAIQISVRTHKQVAVGRELATLIAYILWEGNAWNFCQTRPLVPEKGREIKFSLHYSLQPSPGQQIGSFVGIRTWNE